MFTESLAVCGLVEEGKGGGNGDGEGGNGGRGGLEEEEGREWRQEREGNRDGGGKVVPNPSPLFPSPLA